jgi:hypothetical protein
MICGQYNCQDASRSTDMKVQLACTKLVLLTSTISAGSIGASLSAGSIGISSTLLIGVPYSYEVSRSTIAFVGKANPLIMYAIF